MKVREVLMDWTNRLFLSRFNILSWQTSLLFIMDCGRVSIRKGPLRGPPNLFSVYHRNIKTGLVAEKPAAAILQEISTIAPNCLFTGLDGV